MKLLAAAAALVAPQLAVPLRVLGWFKGRIGSAWAWATASVVHALSLLLALSLAGNVWLWRGWDGALADLAARTKAEAQAATAQVQVNHDFAAPSVTHAKETDEHAVQTQSAVADAVARYAAAHPVRVCGNSASVPASVSGAPDNPQAGSGTDLPADMVAVSRAEHAGLAKNTADLVELRSFLRGEVIAGRMQVVP